MASPTQNPGVATRPAAGHSLRPPSITAVIFVVLSLLAPILLQKPMLNSDGDLARHLRHGRYMLEHARVIRADPFSFTRAGEPFVGFEYGSQLLYALAEKVGGLPAVAVLAGLLIALSYGLVSAFLLRRGVDPLLAVLTVGLAAALGAGHWSARPHLFSFVAIVLLLGLLEKRTRTPLRMCAALFALWANLHGGFVYGWIMIGLYLVGSLGEALWTDDGAASRERARFYFAMLAVATTATLLTPYGLQLHSHLFDFFGQPYLMDHTAEFMSPDFHEFGSKVFLSAVLLSLMFLALYRPRPSLPHLLMVAAGIAFALMSVRNIPLFGLSVLPLLALHVDTWWRRLPDWGGVRGRFEATAGQTSTLAWAVPVGALMVWLGLAGGRVGSLQLIRQNFDDTVFPVAAVADARSRHLEGRIFTEFTWGGYQVYAWPEQKIFIDGGTDFFGEALLREYATIKHLEPGWRQLLKKWDLSLMLLLRESTLAHELAREGRWALVYCDSLAVMLRRAPAPSRLTPRGVDSTEQLLDHCGSGSASLRHSDER